MLWTVRLIGELIDRRFAIRLSCSAVSATGRFPFVVHEGPATVKVFLKFLKRLMRDAKPSFFVIDGHPIHNAKRVKDYVAATI